MLFLADITSMALSKAISCLAFLAQKILQMTISTSVWSAQHPNDGQNIQHLCTLKVSFYNLLIQHVVYFDQDLGAAH